MFRFDCCAAEGVRCWFLPCKAVAVLGSGSAIAGRKTYRMTEGISWVRDSIDNRKALSAILEKARIVTKVFAAFVGWYLIAK